MLNICICQLIKNEHRYIEEWIEYYLNMGISKFILIEDWNSRSHKDILAKYGDKIILHKYDDIVIDEDKTYFNDLRQQIIWASFYRLYKDKFDCCFFIDPDEYLNCSKKEFLTEVEYFYDNPNIYSISYKWLTRTATGWIRDPYPNQIYSVVNTYTDILPGYNLYYKYEEYGNKDYNFNCKHLIYLNKLKTVKDFYAPHGDTKYFQYVQESLFRINHYLTKSWEEYKYRLFDKGEQVKKWARNPDDFFLINKDLLPYKEQLLNECKSQNAKYNDYI